MFFKTKKYLGFFIILSFILFHSRSLVYASEVEDEISIVIAGDLYLGGLLRPYLREFGDDYPFELTKETLGNADLTIVNLESPLTLSGVKFMEKQFILKAAPSMASALKRASIDIVTLANNHIMDYGIVGLRDTLKALDSAGIKYAGAGANISSAREPATQDIRGVRVALLSYSKTYPVEFYAGKNRAGTAPGYEGYLKKDVARAKATADIVIVAFHWGQGKMKTPKHYQVKLAHMAIDSGADLVVGHHPHVPQPVEAYKDGLIFYSLGNFIFGTSPSTYEPKGIIGRITFKKSKDGVSLKAAYVYQLDVANKRVNFRPRLISNQETGSFLTKLREATTTTTPRRFGGKWFHLSEVLNFSELEVSESVKSEELDELGGTSDSSTPSLSKPLEPATLPNLEARQPSNLSGG
ncbi:MAG: CapA family protein [Deltaproteobacteria bacterium]|nr:CapA family protein [Deltaproteobacteria bacterium]